jgi:hypothetical protein
VSTHFKATYITVLQECQNIFIPPLPEGGGRYTVLPLSVCLSVLPSIQDIFRRIFLSNCWWQKSDIWSQASNRYTILWVAFLDPSYSYFLFANLVGFIHIEHICTFFITFFSATIDGRNLIFGHKLHIGTPYRGSVFGPIRFLLPVWQFCWFLYTFNTHLYMHIFHCIFLSNYWWQESDIWSQASHRYAILWEAFLDPSDSYFLFADFVDFYTHWTYILYMSIFSRIFLSNYWWQKSDIWSQASYRYPILWETFFDSSDSYFLFAQERGYHKWALAHSSSC